MNTTIKQYPCDDPGNKDRFLDYHRDMVLYIDELKRWVFYNDKEGWRFADIFRLSEPVVRNIYDEVKQSKDRRKELSAWADASQSLSYQRSMLTMATSFANIKIDKFDANHTVINCKNGIVDLATKELIPRSTKHLYLHKANASYYPDKDIDCPRFKQFLNEIFPDDNDLIRWLQLVFGYSMLGLTREHVLFLCYGSGRNGKGVLLETLGYVLGDYWHTADFGTFLHKEKSNVRLKEAQGKLKGKRFVTAQETSDSSRLDAAVVKRLTGGERLEGAELHASTFTFYPTHTILLSCNHLPNNYDASPAMKQRLKVIPFRESFLEEDDNQEKLLKEILQTEADGIFRWLIDGAHEYLKKNKLSPYPETILEATAEYVDKNDGLSSFVKTCLERDKTCKDGIGAKELYEIYQSWNSSARQSELGRNEFLTKMDERLGIRTSNNKCSRFRYLR